VANTAHRGGVNSNEAVRHAGRGGDGRGAFPLEGAHLHTKGQVPSAVEPPSPRLAADRSPAIEQHDKNRSFRLKVDEIEQTPISYFNCGSFALCDDFSNKNLHSFLYIGFGLA